MAICKYQDFICVGTLNRNIPSVSICSLPNTGYNSVVAAIGTLQDGVHAGPEPMSFQAVYRARMAQYTWAPGTWKSNTPGCRKTSLIPRPPTNKI